MKLQILSDLHLEKEDFNIPETDADIIVLAGDIHERDQAIPWLKKQTGKPVVYVAGNHEFYGTVCPEFKYELKRQAIRTQKGFKRIHKDSLGEDILIEGCQQINFLEQGELELADKCNTEIVTTPDGEFERLIRTSVRFLGCTLWTPHEFAMWGSVRYRQIGAIRGFTTNKPYIKDTSMRVSEFTLKDASRIFENSISWLEYKLKEQTEIPTVVVTHHAPSYKSNNMIKGKKYISDNRLDIQDAYMNSLDAFILEHQPELWIHGHLHCSSDYKVGKTRVICNPRGRGSDEDKNPDFDPKLTVEVQGR